MKIYIAAPYGARGQVRQFCWKLEHLGHQPTCLWAHGSRPLQPGTVHTAPDLPDETVDQYAEGDLADVARCDIFILLTQTVADVKAGGSASGGRHVETGYALALGKLVIIVGEPENIFHRSGFVELVPTWDDVLAMLPEGDEQLPSVLG